MLPFTWLKASIFYLDSTLAFSPSFLFPLSCLVATLNVTTVDLTSHVPGHNTGRELGVAAGFDLISSSFSIMNVNELQNYC